MSYATFPTSGMYGIAACMLGHLGIETDDAALARSIELPCFFSYEDGVLRAGAAHDTPDDLNLALLPLGYHITSCTVPREELLGMLNTLTLAALPLAVTPTSKHCVVYTGKNKQYFCFENPQLPNSPEPPTLELSTVALRNRVEETVTLYTLQACPPQTVDLRARLYRSLRALRQYRSDLLAAWGETYTPRELQTFCTNYLRGLLYYGRPMAKLAGDNDLHRRLGVVLAAFRPMLYGRLVSICPGYYIPLDRPNTLVSGFEDLIIDRMFAHGISDEEIDRLKAEGRRTQRKVPRPADRF